MDQGAKRGFGLRFQRLKVWGLGLQGFGLRVDRFRVWGLRLRVERFMVWGLGGTPNPEP